jgi:hypothetical protein
VVGAEVAETAETACASRLLYIRGIFSISNREVQPAKTYKMTKMADSEEVLFSFRLPKDLKEAFQRTCEAHDRNMSQELGSMIPGYNQRYAGKRRETRDMEVQDMAALKKGDFGRFHSRSNATNRSFSRRADLFSADPRHGSPRHGNARHGNPRHD